MNTLISEICSRNCSFTCFKKDCPRGDWDKSAFGFAPLSKIGTSDECPMLQFEAQRLGPAPSLKDIVSGKAKPSYRLSEEDTWNICEACKYSKITEQINVDGPVISLEDNFQTHCCDCPVLSMRESITECQAEADFS